LEIPKGQSEAINQSRTDNPKEREQKNKQGSPKDHTDN